LLAGLPRPHDVRRSRALFASVTELIVRELRLRRFDAIVPTAAPRFASAVEVSGDARRHPPAYQRVERLAARHSRRRPQADELGL
jgi:hypothetical protein